MSVSEEVSASHGLPFGPNGCEAQVDGAKCGETKTLRIVDEFRELYEQKMEQIDTIAGGDCTQAKIKLQQEWINDLTSQNELLVRAVEELELEATERVRMLEEKMKQNAELTYEVMRKYRDFEFPLNVDENLQKLNLMQNDVNGLLEFIRRVREEGEWNADGLRFYQIKYEDLFGHSCKCIEQQTSDDERNDSLKRLDEANSQIKNKKGIIHRLEDELMSNAGKIDTMKSLNDAYDEISELKKSMKEMRDALTAEVADKHDVIIMLRRDIVHLEDQCRKADQQTHFKDDIIKELRKEIKQLKNHPRQRSIEEQIITTTIKSNNNSRAGSSKCTKCQDENDGLRRRIEELQADNEKLKDAIKLATEHLNSLEAEAEKYLEEKSTMEMKHKENEMEIEKLRSERNQSEENYQRERRESMNRMSALEQEKASVEEEHKQMCGNVTVYVDQLEKYKKDTEKLVEEINQLKEERAKAEETANKLKEENKEQEVKLRECKNKVSQLKNKLKRGSKDPNASTSDDFDFGSDSSDFKTPQRFNATKRSRSADEPRTSPAERSRRASGSVDLNRAVFEEVSDIEIEEKIIPKKDTTLLHSKQKSSSPKSDSESNKTHSNSLKTSKSEGDAELEEVIDQLSESVHRMMGARGKKGSPSSKANEEEESALKKLKEKEAEMENERNSRNREIKNLKSTIVELEKALKDAQVQGYNLQKAVDIYLESISILEKSDERSKLEIQQQRLTISNLQEALVETKKQLEELQSNATQELSKNWELVNLLHYKLTEMENLYICQLQEWEELNGVVRVFQDMNLELEVENISVKEDLEITESYLKKYQQSSLATEKCICSLKMEIKELKAEKERSLQTINLLQSELQKCTNDLLQLQDILNCSIEIDEQNKHLLEELELLKRNSLIFQKQFDDARKQIGRERQINKLNVERIEELQGIICKKNMDNKKLVDSLGESKRLFEKSFRENQRLQDELEKSQEMNAINAAQTNFCHTEINNCLQNLAELKEKMRKETELVNQKVMEYTQLQATYNNQCCDMEILRREIDSTTLYYKDEIIELKHQIKDLSDSSAKAEARCKALQEELKESRGKLVDATEREALVQQFYSEQEGILMQKIHQLQNEEIRLIDVNTALDKELTELKEALHSKEKMLQTSRTALQKLKTETCQKNARCQDELGTLRTELTALMDKYTILYNENVLLQKDVAVLSKLKVKIKSLNEQLQDAFSEIKALSKEKSDLYKKNEELTQEVNTLYTTVNDMNDEYNYKTESVMVELVDTKNSRDTLCQEGRKVIKNVRSWIMEQQTINKRLKDDLRTKKATISKLQRENQSLHSTMNIDVNRSASPANKGGNTLIPYKKKTFKTKRASSPVKALNNWDLGSEGSTSGRDSPYSVSTSVQLEWYNEPEHEDNFGEPTAWVNRVENMTQELQKSNKYFQNKLQGHDVTTASRDG